MNLFSIFGIRIFLFGTFMFVSSVLFSLFLYPSILSFILSGVVARIIEEATIYALLKTLRNN